MRMSPIYDFWEMSELELSAIEASRWATKLATHPPTNLATHPPTENYRLFLYVSPMVHHLRVWNMHQKPTRICRELGQSSKELLHELFAAHTITTLKAYQKLKGEKQIL
jgi:hypothetical protein